ncbi:MAG TPA: hypothetical protein VHM64_07790, partial [Candidatus Binatia bacterium]|nr:hypothetical protein [Candidatus Binatia bacterium]
MKAVILLLFPFLFALSELRAADSPEPTLPTLFVTATRTETPLEQVTTSASVITAEDIEAQEAETVLEALRNV